MSAATKTAYQPRILTPTMKRPQPGITVYLVESHTANEFYFVWVQPSGNIRCQCTAAKFGNECCHKKALSAHLIAQHNAEQRAANDALYEQMKQADPAGEAAYRREMATFACARTGYGKETAPLADSSYAGSIFK